VTSHTAAVWLAYVDTGHTATYLFIGALIRYDTIRYDSRV